ncbi:MAG TPA: hypothetical protein VHI53_06585 [Gaiellaceae bacterium]|nr:hypothetical protein [Gaiellaceae bacterium]
MVPDRAANRRDGEGGEIVAALAIETIDRLDQPDGANLDEVLQALATMGELPSDGSDERQVELDESLAERRVTRSLVRTHDEPRVVANTEYPCLRIAGDSHSSISLRQDLSPRS